MTTASSGRVCMNPENLGLSIRTCCLSSKPTMTRGTGGAVWNQKNNNTFRSIAIASNYNPGVRVEELRILLALEPTWTVSLNGLEFFSIPSSDISISDSAIQIGARVRKIVDVQWLRPSVVQIRARAKFRTNLDVIKLYPGERLPSIVDLRRRRRAFLRQIAPALCSWFGIRKIERETLHSDRQHGISGAYPRFLIGRNAVIAV